MGRNPSAPPAVRYFKVEYDGQRDVHYRALVGSLIFYWHSAIREDGWNPSTIRPYQIAALLASGVMIELDGRPPECQELPNGT